VDHLILGRRLLKAEHYDAVIPLTNYLDLSYFHWTLEAGGRLALVEDQLKDPAWKVLISEKKARYLRGALEFLFGLDEARVVSGTAKRKVMHRCLMVSNPHSRSLPGAGVEVYPPEHIRWLNTRGHERIGGVRPERRNIVISRRKQIGRKITNEEVLLQRFPQLNLEFVTLEDLSLREQVDTFAHAGVIIAVHGAGLANLVYATDAAVIELYPTPLQPKNSAYFVQIAACLGLPHLVLHYEGTGPAPHWDVTLTTEQLDHMERFLRKEGRV
jgi:capsular polysaccharide biosynthesis protein